MGHASPGERENEGTTPSLRIQKREDSSVSYAGGTFEAQGREANHLFPTGVAHNVSAPLLLFVGGVDGRV